MADPYADHAGETSVPVNATGGGNAHLPCTPRGGNLPVKLPHLKDQNCGLPSQLHKSGSGDKQDASKKKMKQS